jgi:hypothetical protein
MSLYDMRRELADARSTLENADQVAGEFGYILRGRLKHLPGSLLEDLKRELRDFNMHTHKWK